MESRQRRVTPTFVRGSCNGGGGTFTGQLPQESSRADEFIGNRRQANESAAFIISLRRLRDSNERRRGFLARSDEYVVGGGGDFLTEALCGGGGHSAPKYRQRAKVYSAANHILPCARQTSKLSSSFSYRRRKLPPPPPERRKVAESPPGDIKSEVSEQR